ncbi:hypothetical protein [Bailinhaonella thermotolerans]|uniref:hypothetical protein n=1 Tax=Bailinhaonella thermotolerans TaxID=1070861 RepID=UPI00192A6912|nr:hypothetical protein [Bailinhaonella thermotolerans]
MRWRPASWAPWPASSALLGSPRHRRAAGGPAGGTSARSSGAACRWHGPATARRIADPARFAGRALELAGDQPTPVEAAAAISEATGVPIRYQQLTDDEAAALGQGIADAKKRWEAGHRWHADIEALRVIHPGLRTLTDWLTESGAAAIRARLTTP